MLESPKLEAVFRLIQSMDNRERRLYRRHAGRNLRNGESNYLKLFNLLSEMPHLQKEHLKSKLEKLGLVKHFATLQTRLFDHVLNFLRLSEEFPSVEVKLNEAFERIEILYQRGLHSESKKELRKAQALAMKYDNYMQLLRLADLERQYFFVAHSRHTMVSKDENKFRDIDWIQALKGQVELKLINFEMHFVSKLHLPHQRSKAELTEKFDGRSIQKVIAETEGSISDMMMLDAIGMLSQMDGDFDLAYLAYSRLDSLWVTGAEMIVENARIYISFMTSFLNSCLLKGRYNEFRNLLANLKTVHFGKAAYDLMLKELLLYIELIYCLNRCEFEKGLLLEPEIEKFVANYRYRIESARMIAFHFNIFSLHFMQGQYRKANRWLVRILNMPPQDYRKDIQDVAPLLQLILFVAMEDRELLSIRLRAYLRMQRNTKGPELASLIISFCTDFLKSKDSEEKTLLENFENKLNEFFKHTKGTRAGAGECLFWAVGRRTQRLPGEVFREFVMAQATD